MLRASLILIVFLGFVARGVSQETPVADPQVQAALKALGPRPADPLRPPDWEKYFRLMDLPKNIRGSVKRGAVRALNGSPAHRRWRDGVEFDLFLHERSWVGLPPRDASPILRAVLPDIDFAPISEGVAMITLSGALDIEDASGLEDARGVATVAALMNREGLVIESYVGRCWRFSLKKIEPTYGVPCKLPPDASHVAVGFISFNWTPIPTAWRDKQGTAHDFGIVPIDRDALAAAQNAKAEREHQERLKKAAADSLAREEAAKRKIVAAMDIRVWTDKAGEIIARAEFVGYDKGRVELKTDALEYIDVPLSTLSKESARNVRNILKERKAKEREQKAKNKAK